MQIHIAIGLQCVVDAKRGFHLYAGVFTLRSIYFEILRAEDVARTP